ncbi:glycerophosphodiester phosphodiesterase [Psychrobacter sp. Sarcosine-3u-12]|uniref:glycerophosphodiester phosphodiesterase n=1 Tax=Psychrobacter sp. Sarcosine-3u-12 TaxID=2058325 RepID=UPI000C33B1C5|nr:glycerophosphodiester phosphodiesterase [Psychrobacter sp. Sarcosine-3u-12]PKG34140.1 glycerophosphodiester phosphodiesterase [Psychrobacter sp. Sarcosine-3u-12]
MINLNNTLLLGHRGARGEAVENTLAGFEHAQRLNPQGLAGVEFDVQLSADEQLIVFHDDNLQRMCGQQSRIDQLTLAEIQRYRQDKHPLITLDRAYQALTNFSYIELEIKTHERTDYGKLIRALMHDLIDSPLASLPIALTSFDVELHARLQRNKTLQHIPRGLLIRTPKTLLSAPQTALQLGCVQLGIHYPLLTQAVIKHCHRYHLPVSAWTVNDSETIKQLITWQVDVIITDYPTYFLTR